ncbi:MAG TPA: lysozyme inhibitor LprI family protein [Cytophagaceae bacterium]
MKILIVLFLALLLNINGFGQSQADMNREAYADYQKTDKELNEIYKKVLSSYKADTAFIRNLKESQRVWIKFRDAELAMKYPEREAGHYGSIHPVCKAYYLQQLTTTRIKTLQEWLNGIEEGDSCMGSVKMKE